MLSVERRNLYAKTAIGAKALGIDDDALHDLLESRYGQRSRKSLSESQLIDLLEHFKRCGFRVKNQKKQTDPQLKKARALWISAYWLGITKSRTDKALVAFINRQTGLAHPAWMRQAGDARKVIEALKSWLTREGSVCWDPYAHATRPPIHNPRARVMEAQWRLLAKRGLVRISDQGALSSYVNRFLNLPCATSHSSLAPAQADRVIVALGKWLRRAK